MIFLLENPEAFQISNIRADTIVQALIEGFARIGLPREISHDQRPLCRK